MESRPWLADQLSEIFTHWRFSLKKIGVVLMLLEVWGFASDSEKYFNTKAQTFS